MKIGFFDSGVGGLSIAKEVISALAAYDYFYLGDNKRAPYGNRSQEEIYEYTKEGIAWLFAQDCALVIIACNTASSQALRRLQQEWLPAHYPDRKLLGIIVPIAQEVVGDSKGIIGIVGTKATVSSQTYNKEFRKIKPNLKIIQVAIPELATLIENDAPREQIKALLELYLFPLKEAGIDTLVLACTHYPLVAELFHELLGLNVAIPDTGKIVAQKLREYLARHKEIEAKLEKQGTRKFFTTANPETFSRLGEKFFGAPTQAESINLAQ